MLVKIETEGLSGDENTKIKLACEKIERVCNSEAFKNWVLNFSYPVQRCVKEHWYSRKVCTSEQRACFAYVEGLTNHQVYNKIMAGAEVLDPVVDGEADVFLKIDPRTNYSVIGYTYANTKWQWIYRNRFRDYTIDDLSSNIAHEYLHKLGFDHPYKWTADREYSVPYCIGYYVGRVRE